MLEMRRSWKVVREYRSVGHKRKRRVFLYSPVPPVLLSTPRASSQIRVGRGRSSHVCWGWLIIMGAWVHDELPVI
jgi:hypothetical protein